MNSAVTCHSSTSNEGEDDTEKNLGSAPKLLKLPWMKMEYFVREFANLAPLGIAYSGCYSNKITLFT